MARRPKNKFKAQRTKETIFQDSPFLRLPGEIRDLIYFKALVKPHHIDLVPAVFVELNNDTLDPVLAKELARRRTKCKCCDKRPGNFCTCVWKVRHQVDLQFVRKELATGLLATCRQIFNEAQHIYWSMNTFRFSDDCHWNGVRRFLTTIGSRACSQLRSLEVFAPLEDIHPIEYYIPPNPRGVWGNFPKMHMHKFGKIPMNPDYWNQAESSDNIGLVLQLLDHALANLNLRFIVPKGQYIDVMQYAAPVWPRVSLLRAPYRTALDLSDLPFYENVLNIIPRWHNVMLLVLEAGSECRAGVEFLETCAFNGIGVVCCSGSSYRANPNIKDLTEIIESRRWMDPNADLDQLIGLSDLFVEQDRFSSVPGRGGKATKGTGQKTVLRRLKGFGGCRFTERWGFDCTVCGKTGIYITDQASREWQYCSHCSSSSNNWEKRRVVEMKRMFRAIRKGYVDSSMVLVRNRFPPLSLST